MEKEIEGLEEDLEHNTVRFWFNGLHFTFKKYKEWDRPISFENKEDDKQK